MQKTPEIMEQNIPATIEELKSQVMTMLSDTDRSIVAIFTSYIHPYCENGVSFREFLIPLDEIIALPPNFEKLRIAIFRVIIEFAILRQTNSTDPIDQNDFDNIIRELRMIFSLALAMDGSMMKSIFDDLESIFGDDFSLTFAKLKNSLGIYEKNEKVTYDIPEVNLKRIHYDDQKVVRKNEQKKDDSMIKAFLVNSRNSIGNQKSFLSRTVKIRMKKPKYGPQGRTKPLFS